MKGGELVFTMGDRPVKDFGTAEGDYPVSAIQEHLITPVPSISYGHRTFMDSTVIALSCPMREARIYYTLDGNEPDVKSELYIKPLTISENKTLKAFAYVESMPASKMIETKFLKIPKNRKIVLNTKYASQYSGGGDYALIDFIRGGENFRTGTWQGYEGVDLEVIVDLGSEQTIKNVTLGCLQDQNSWIFMPLEVIFYLSDDGTSFREAGIIRNDIDEHLTKPVMKEFSIEADGSKARYLKVIARNRGVCPSWHLGAGNKAWIFADEIIIN
jgi:hypothetical protein